MDLNTPLGAAGCSQRLKDKLAVVVWLQPCSAQPDGDLTCCQVRGLHLGQSIHIGLILRIAGCKRLHIRQFLPHITGEIFVCRNVLVVDALLIVRVQEYHAGQVGKKLFLALAGKLFHVLHVYPCLFAYGQSQTLYRSVHVLSGLMAADGALGEQISLARQFAIFVQNLQRTQQEVRAVL